MYNLKIMHNYIFHILSNIRKLEHVQDETLRDQVIDELEIDLNKWRKFLEKQQPQSVVFAEIALIIENNTHQLLFIKDSILQINKIRFRSLHDVIFKNLLKLNIKPPTLTTSLFGEFIKGITYFSVQEKATQLPIYHRLISCGPKSPSEASIVFRKRFNQCHPSMSLDDRKDVKQRIQTCQIERLVYDEIYKNVELFLPGEDRSQNASHLHRLLLTQDDFKSCFPNVKLDVKVSFRKFAQVMKPVTLTITRTVQGSTHPHHPHVSTLVFKRETILLHDGTVIYQPEVECLKYIESKSWFKIQDFNFENKKWERTS